MIGDDGQLTFEGEDSCEGRLVHDLMRCYLSIVGGALAVVLGVAAWGVRAGRKANVW